MNQSDKIGAWKKTVKTKNGEVEVISFTINGQRYSMWPNNFKKEEKHPDYQITVDTYDAKDKNKAVVPQYKNVNDDLPF